MNASAPQVTVDTPSLAATAVRGPSRRSEDSGLCSSPAPPAGTVIIGRIVVRDSSGVAIDFPGNASGAPLPARSTVGGDHLMVGQQVVLVFENGDLFRPIILGALESPATTMVRAELDGERVVVNAEQEIVLRCGEASLTLTRAGKVLIRGSYILARSSGANRIKGATVEIN